MNVKIITCHDVYNYGASLQAYALMNFIQLYSNKVEIIDYKPEYLDKRYNFWFIEPTSKYYKHSKKYKLLHVIYAVLHYKSRFRTVARKKPFDEFTKNYLHLTSIKYNSSSELQINPPNADLFIAGSDQIWNTYFDNGNDGAFFLDFAPLNSKRISYAASFGSETLKQGSEFFIQEKVKYLDAVSVREKAGISILNKLGISNVVQVLDPVFLLSSENWESIIKRKYDENYLLIYDFLQDNSMIETISKTIAAMYSLKIYSINDLSTLNFASKNISNAGPIEFLEYIYSAQFIITTSFHATAFSIIFHKQFLTFELKSQNNSSRMSDLLGLIGCSERFNIDQDQLSKIQEVNFNLIDNNILKYKEQSKLYLKQFI